MDDSGTKHRRCVQSDTVSAHRRRYYEMISDARLNAFQADLPYWFDACARDLPWRRTRDPYLIWISEIMLQQTRVDQAIPYFHRFTSAFPTVEALAAASLDDVLQIWEGLGYYARARNLHRAARHIAETSPEGQIPDTHAEILKLPGIGQYTAAAVLSIAFDRPYAVLDGNVARVLARVFAFTDDLKSTGGKKALRTHADALVPSRRPGRYNEAMMELGATVCTPTAPRCPACPLRPVCTAFAQGDPVAYPVVKTKAPIPHYPIAVGLVRNDDGLILIQKRPENGLLGGLWEFPGGKQESGESLEETCVRELREELGIEVEVADLFHRLAHAYTHFRITLHAFTCTLKIGTARSKLGQPVRWVQLGELRNLAFPRANRRLIDRLLKSEDVRI